jgi:hypothetical protein
LINGTPVVGKDKTRWPISNGTETKRHVAETIIADLANWLPELIRHIGERLFMRCDEEANWRGWEITTLHGGLGRSYRDPRFATRNLDSRRLGSLDGEP